MSKNDQSKQELKHDSKMNYGSYFKKRMIGKTFTTVWFLFEPTFVG